MADEAVISEVRDVLRGASRALTSGEVFALTEIAEGRGVVASALNELVRNEEVDCSNDDGARRFWLCGALASTQSKSNPEPETEAEPEPDTEPGVAESEPSRQEELPDSPAPRRGSVRRQIYDLLARRAPHLVSAEDARQKLGLTRKQVSNGLQQLRRSGYVRRGNVSSSGYATGWTITGERQVEPPEQRETVKEHTESIAAEGREPETPERSAEAVFCFRSDGALEVRRGSESVELTRDETRILIDYLGPFVMRQRAMAATVPGGLHDRG